MKKQNQAFTLVELIVVITILAILGTIAFISLQGYSAQARDTTRITDIQNIKTSLELFSINTGKFPFPDDSLDVTYTGSLLWKQGIIGDGVSTNLSRNLNTKPLDPLTEQEYTYSVTHSQTEYELLSVYESDLVSYNNLLNETNAATANYPKINGTYNGVYIKISDYYIPTPSIINAEILDSNMVLDNINIKSQIITGGENILANGNQEVQTGDLLGLELIPYNGTITSNSDDFEKVALIQAIQDAYTGSILANQGVYLRILETEEDDMDELVDNFVLGGDIVVSSGGENNGEENSIDNISCNTILNSGGSTGNGIYNIDPEDNGIGFDVYCDMITDGGGWTLMAYSKGVVSSSVWMQDNLDINISSANTQLDTTWKYSDNLINIIKGENGIFRLNTYDDSLNQDDKIFVGNDCIYNHTLAPASLECRILCTDVELTNCCTTETNFSGGGIGGRASTCGFTVIASFTTIYQNWMSWNHSLALYADMNNVGDKYWMWMK